jgi:hypothetical protein
MQMVGLELIFLYAFTALFFAGCGFFYGATRRLENHNPFSHQRWIQRPFPCSAAHFLHTAYVELCYRHVHMYVALHRKSYSAHM